MFPWWVRLFIFLPLAALQIILLTISALGWQYEVGFERFMILLGDMVSSALQLNLIEAVIRDVLASWDIVLPELGKHWHHVFVLQWLFLSATARLVGNEATYLEAKIPLFLLAGLCAFLSAFAVGTMRIDNVAVLAWPTAGFFAFSAGIWRWRQREGMWPITLLVAATFAALPFFSFTGAHLLFLAVSSTPLGLVLSGDSWALVVLAGVICGAGGVRAATGILYLLADLTAGVEHNQQHHKAGIASGLDLLGPFAVAATLAWMFGKYMPV